MTSSAAGYFTPDTPNSQKAKDSQLSSAKLASRKAETKLQAKQREVCSTWLLLSATLSLDTQMNWIKPNSSVRPHLMRRISVPNKCKQRICPS